jgi:hypothetical protein
MDRLLRQRRVGRKQMFPAAESGREVQGAAIAVAAVAAAAVTVAAETDETVVVEADGTVAGIAEEIVAVEAAKAGVDTDGRLDDGTVLDTGFNNV